MSNPYLPNTTQFPDFLLDYWMAEVDHAEWKVLCYIVRHTYGFRKTMDALSIRQFTHGMRGSDGSFLNNGCGIKSHSTLCRALQSLEERGLIRRYAQPAAKGKNTPVTRYELTFKEVAVDEAKLRLVAGGGVRSQNTPPVCDERTPGVRSQNTGCAMREHTTPTLTTPTLTTPTETVPPPPPAVAHGRGREEGGIALPRFTIHEDLPSVDGSVPDHQIDAAVVALAAVLGQQPDRTFRYKWHKHVRRFLGMEPEADLYGCLRWMLTDPFWQEKRDQRRLTINHVLDRLDEWRSTGCPATRPRAHSRPSQGVTGSIPRTATATDAALRAAHDRIEVCDTCHKELGWGTCAACQARAAHGGLE